MLARPEILEILRAKGSDCKGIFAGARNARRVAFGDSAIVRGVVEVTNICRVDCDYCPMRRENNKLNSSFVLSSVDILNAATEIKALDIDIVFLQGGEIQGTTRLVGSILPKIRELFGESVEVLLNLGNKTRDEYAYLRDQGATSYILKHETSDPNLYQKLRHESLRERLRCMSDLLELGYRVGSGTIVGLPRQSLESIADDILLCLDLGVHMCSASPFVPAPSTPLESFDHGSVDVTLNAIAAMRLANPKWLVPTVSALEAIRPGAQFEGLRAGANVLTVNFSPQENLGRYLIYGRDRFVVGVQHVLDLLAKAELQRRGSTFLN